MNQTALLQAIRDRVLSDITVLSGSFGLATTAIVSESGTPDQGGAFPLVVITPVALTISPDEGFAHDMSVFEWRFDSFGKRDEGFAKVYGIQGRLYGNYSLVSNGPTFGLHRHRLVLPTATAAGWVCDECQFIQCTPLHDEDVLHYSDLYRVRIQRTRPAS